ncbi:MAG: hypothetical protein R3185_02905, partial [Candidatus Thermoplasmatota archaeon]|nr:hypothetical protein [Candidatus Thermoplasmatota archaeon]
MAENRDKVRGVSYRRIVEEFGFALDISEARLEEHISAVPEGSANPLTHMLADFRIGQVEVLGERQLRTLEQSSEENTRWGRTRDKVVDVISEMLEDAGRLKGQVSSDSLRDEIEGFLKDVARKNYSDFLLRKDVQELTRHMRKGDRYSALLFLLVSNEFGPTPGDRMGNLRFVEQPDDANLILDAAFGDPVGNYRSSDRD